MLFAVMVFVMSMGEVECSALGPSFVQEPPAFVLFSNATGAIVDCVASGEPEPVIDWVDANGNILPIMPSVARYSGVQL